MRGYEGYEGDSAAPPHICVASHPLSLSYPLMFSSYLLHPSHIPFISFHIPFIPSYPLHIPAFPFSPDRRSEYRILYSL